MDITIFSVEGTDGRAVTRSTFESATEWAMNNSRKKLTVYTIYRMVFKWDGTMKSSTRLVSYGFGRLY